ncbi:MAG: glycosyl hydrolase-related protein [bacterium]|nr:glycosyl hydrolase-related protein [bacterium]
MEKILELERIIKDVQKKIEEQITVKWKFIQGIENGENPDIDDSGWEEKTSNARWQPNDGPAYFRTYFTVPDIIEGVKIEGSEISIIFLILSNTKLFINGKEIYSQKYWADTRGGPVITFVKNAIPGERYFLVFKTSTADGFRYFSAQIVINRVEEVLFELNSLLFQLKFAMELSKKSKNLQKNLDKALSFINVQDIKDRNWDNILNDIKKAEEALEPFRKEAKRYTVHLIGHAHIDMNWLWTYEDTIDTCLRDFDTVTKLMDRYPDLTFSQSQAHIYKIVEDHNPALFEKVKEKVKEGRWDITASSWVESDMNIVDGESFIRHILYANKYISENFGVKSEIFWAPDGFGHAGTLPSILAGAGIKYYYFMRCGKGLPLLRWKGKDGSELLAFNSIYNNSIRPETTIPVFLEYHKRYNLPDFLFVYGVGDHGGGPTEADIKRKQKMETKPVLPKLEFSTTLRYFRAVERYRNKIPVVADELNATLEGCYTTHSDIKKANRTGETMLLSLETLSVIMHMKGISAPEKELEELWRTVLFNQFHDIIDGSAIHSSYEFSGKLADEVEKKCSELSSTLLEKLVQKNNKHSITLFNPLGWKRKYLYEEKNQETFVEIPGYGYKTICIEECKNISGKGKLTINKDGLYDYEEEYENEFYIMKMDRQTGIIKRLFDKKNSREVLFTHMSIWEDIYTWYAEKGGNLISVCWEAPHSASAWLIGNIYRIENLFNLEEIKTITENFKTTIYIKRTYRNSEIIQKIFLYNDFPYIDFVNQIVWNEEGNSKEGVPMLRVNFHTALKNPDTYFEIPFGAIKREPIGKEYPALKWAGQKEGNYWVVLMNKEKHGYNIDGNNLSLTLLRNPYEPDAVPDKGKHLISYRLFFGKSSITDITKLAMEYNTPPLAISGKTESEEFYPFEIKGNVVPTSFKRALGRNSYILRLVEVEGKKEIIKIDFVKKPKKVYITNSVEKREKELKGWRGKSIKFNIAPYRILTLEIQF